MPRLPPARRPPTSAEPAGPVAASAAATAPPARDPRVLVEDADVLVIDKPAGWLVDGEDSRGVLGWARRREQAAGRPAGHVRLVHRLDRDTSGVLVIAKTDAAARALGDAFANRRVWKVYLALTATVPGVRWARVEHQLAGRRVGHGERMVVVAEGGQLATSEVEVFARGRQLALVRVLPEQGRKHQVRVALAELGAAIAGDYLYGGTAVARRAPRIMLHAFGLDLAHPSQPGRHLRLRAPLPPDMLALFHDDGGSVPSDLDRRHTPTSAATAPRRSEGVAAQAPAPPAARPRRQR